MAVLLDTPALLWALTAPDRLGAQARQVIEDAAADVVVSAASAWELGVKSRLGLLPQADALLAAYPQHLDRLEARRLPIDDRHALLAGRLDWSHPDPFDRMLAAQAMIESLTLATGDEAFADLPGLRLLW